MRKNNMKRVITLVLSVLFVILSIGGLRRNETGAYFSDQVSGEGSASIQLEYETKLDEVVSEGNKDITIENTGETDVWVRLRIFTGEADAVEYVYDDSKWTLEGDWYYYNEILKAGEKTDSFKVNVTKENVKDYNFQIIVVQECERVVYDGDDPVPGFGR